MNMSSLLSGCFRAGRWIRAHRRLVPPSCLMAAGAVLISVGIASAQHPILDMIADNVVKKYQNSTCQQLWQERAQQQSKPRSQQEQDLVQLLRGDPQLRAEFINRVAAPVVTKMFECGMVP